MTGTSPPRATPHPRKWVQAHRWISLGAAAFWLIQAITGLLILFQWELKDAAISNIHRPTDIAAIEQRMNILAPPGSGEEVTSIWVTAGLPDRYDINVSNPATEASQTFRVAGDGTVLRGPDDSNRLIDFIDTLISIHHGLLAGDTGEWIVGISGLLLLSNLVMGLIIAWPRKGTWARTLKPARAGPSAARLYSWHRVVGLWAVLPAFLLVGSGVLLRFQHGTAALIGSQSVTMDSIPSSGPAIPFSKAVAIAAEAFPGSKLTMANMPNKDDATYQIQMLAPGEIRRAYGTSTVFINASTSSIRGTFPAAEAPGPRAFMDSLYALHTGEAAGLPGRLLTGAIGLWLASMVIMGIMLWSKRRRRPTRPLTG